jgi:hypothetical protein
MKIGELKGPGVCLPEARSLGKRMDRAELEEMIDIVCTDGIMSSFAYIPMVLFEYYDDSEKLIAELRSDLDTAEKNAAAHAATSVKLNAEIGQLDAALRASAWR